MKIMFCKLFLENYTSGNSIKVFTRFSSPQRKTRLLFKRKKNIHRESRNKYRTFKFIPMTYTVYSVYGKDITKDTY